MFKCKKCQGNKVRTKTNYSYGRKSKSSTTAVCRDCGYIDFGSDKKGNKKDFKRRRNNNK